MCLFWTIDLYVCIIRWTHHYLHPEHLPQGWSRWSDRHEGLQIDGKGCYQKHISQSVWRGNGEPVTVYYIKHTLTTLIATDVNMLIPMRCSTFQLKRFDKLLEELHPNKTLPKWGNLVPRSKHIKVHKGVQYSNGFCVLKCIENYNGKELIKDLNTVSDTHKSSPYVILHRIDIRYMICAHLVILCSYDCIMTQLETRSLVDEYLFWVLFCPANEMKDELPEDIKAFAPMSKWARADFAYFDGTEIKCMTWPCMCGTIVMLVQQFTSSCPSRSWYFVNGNIF